MSPTLFNLYLNNLAVELNNPGLGLNIHGTSLATLLYADGMVLLSDSEHKLQEMLNIMSNWCKKWRIKVNVSKTNVMHFRPK